MMWYWERHPWTLRQRKRAVVSSGKIRQRPRSLQRKAVQPMKRSQAQRPQRQTIQRQPKQQEITPKQWWNSNGCTGDIPEEENSTSGGPAVIFINVVKVFFCIVGIAVLIFLALLLRTFFKNYHFAHRSTRLTWRFNRRRNRSRSRYRSVDQDLRNRRKEAIRQAKNVKSPRSHPTFAGSIPKGRFPYILPSLILTYQWVLWYTE